jgi:hypothetical protein
MQAGDYRRYIVACKVAGQEGLIKLLRANLQELFPFDYAQSFKEPYPNFLAEAFVNADLGDDDKDNAFEHICLCHLTNKKIEEDTRKIFLNYILSWDSEYIANRLFEVPAVKLRTDFSLAPGVMEWAVSRPKEVLQITRKLPEQQQKIIMTSKSVPAIKLRDCLSSYH